MPSSILRICALVVLGFCGTQSIHAADPQPYAVDIASTEDAAMDGVLTASSELESLKDSAPVSPFGLIARARGDVERLKTVLESFGYYEARVTIKIDGRGLNDGALGDALGAMSKEHSARVTIGLEPGALYHLRRVDIDGAVPDSARRVLGLKSGDPAVASKVLAAGGALLTFLQERGYAFAKVDPPIAYQDAGDPLLDVSFHVESGPIVHIGRIRIDGLQRVREKLVRARLALHTADPFSPSTIERARHDLLALGPFASISVEVGTAVDGLGGVAVTFLVRERLRHAVAINAAYSSDLGANGGITWSHRNVFGGAEQLNVAASAINVGGGSAATGIGYDTSAKFVKPDFGRRDQSLQIAVGAIKQSLQAYDQTARSGGLTLTRRLSSIWTASAGLSMADEQIIQQGIRHNYTLVALPVVLTYDSTNLNSPLDDPRHGMRDSLSVSPTRATGRPNASFIISQIKIAAYLDLDELIFTGPGRSVLAFRALAGLAQGAGELSLPPDQRFYGGGSGTIRGYRYQSVGPKFADGNPIGGTAILAATMEYRQRLGANLGAAVFVDAGRVSASLKSLPNALRIGAGIGIRYYTPVGPIRLDIAVPTKRHGNDDAFEIYVGLGQAF